MEKYLVIGGWVKDGGNGRRRHLSAQVVMGLYGLTRVYCDLAPDLNSLPDDLPDGTTILLPDPTGKYELPR